MLKSMTGAIVAVAALGGLAAQTIGASAMPMIDRSPAVAAEAATGSTLEDVRWVCGPYRCFRRPDYYRPFYPAYGFHRPYYGGRRGWHPGWHRGWHRW